MSISLYKHNETAYEAALSMLEDEGKAAVVHPTGTGKSFIGFKLCEAFPDNSVCWLSPSEYIFRTQMENLQAAAEGWRPQNICFFTYAKLMQTESAELADLNPDYIILDEFHRCGAEMWGAGVKRLLELYPNAKVLGLSATAIRYLDNQRNMVDELFDGNIASEMSLGEAIVRGILEPPRYVLSVFAYKKDYERLKSRVHRAKSKAVRDKAERYLDALRRALEMADGLDRIFDKHIIDRHGKYIVFCSNVEHMQEMIKHVPEWFGRIDQEPHVYSAYSDDPASSKAFDTFKNDESDHLKLLFCIDMLNEGIHVEDVSGVILIRPTVSPIIYKQQIGRALSASKSKEPVIFDIVNNIENLYSIDSVEREMQAAVSYYRFSGREGEIVNERFRVVDEVRDVRELFDSLNDALTASWDEMYACAQRYYADNGDLEVPRRYKTKEGYSLGNWVFTQRKVYAGEQYGLLDEERIRKLESIGMVWESVRDLSWKRYFEAARQYYDTHGDLKVPAPYTCKDSLKLGAWIARLRTYRKSGIRTAYLTEDRIAKLDSIGMLWGVVDYLWEENYLACMKYFQQYGDLDIANDYRSEDGLRIGAWLHRQKQLYRGSANGTALSPDQIRRLTDIGIIWETRSERAWNRGYENAKAYYEQYGDLFVPTAYVSPNGFKLGAWIADRREKGKNKHSAEQQRQLDLLGMVWKKPDSWEERYKLARRYYTANGHLQIPADYKENGIWLGKWLDEQKQIYKGRREGQALSADRIQRLEAVGMDWRTKAERSWQENYHDAEVFFEANGNLDVPASYKGSSGKALANWLIRQRSLFREGRLFDEQVALLEKIGMVWELDDAWEIGFSHAKAYFEEHNDLSVPGKYICGDGYPLGRWITNQRANGKSTERHRALKPFQIKRLEAIGMDWSPSESRWTIGLEHAEAYLKTLNGDKFKTCYVSPDGFKTGDWLRNQMRAYKNGTLSSDKASRLRAIGLTEISQIIPIPERTTAEEDRGVAI